MARKSPLQNPLLCTYREQSLNIVRNTYAILDIVNRLVALLRGRIFCADGVALSGPMKQLVHELMEKRQWTK